MSAGKTEKNQMIELVNNYDDVRDSFKLFIFEYIKSLSEKLKIDDLEKSEGYFIINEKIYIIGRDEYGAPFVSEKLTLDILTDSFIKEFMLDCEIIKINGAHTYYLLKGILFDAKEKIKKELGAYDFSIKILELINKKGD